MGQSQGSALGGVAGESSSGATSTEEAAAEGGDLAGRLEAQPQPHHSSTTPIGIPVGGGRVVGLQVRCVLVWLVFTSLVLRYGCWCRPGAGGNGVAWVAQSPKPLHG
jgi:hypothetical protein